MSCNCFCDRRKLPIINNYDLIRCIRINMSNGEQYTVKTGDLVGIQFIKNDKQILLRKGRIKEINVVNKRCLSTETDNVSCIILDASEQFSIKLIEIKLKDIIKIGAITDEFPDYSDRITELEPNFVEECKNGVKIPTRHDGMITKEELQNKITKPGRDNVAKMNPCTGEFDDLYTMNQNRPDIDYLRVEQEEPEEKPKDEPLRVTKRGFRLTR